MADSGCLYTIYFALFVRIEAGGQEDTDTEVVVHCGRHDERCNTIVSGKFGFLRTFDTTFQQKAQDLGIATSCSQKNCRCTIL
jgi:hypothetical protein